MLGFSEIMIGPLNQRPICTGNKRGLCFHILFMLFVVDVMFLLSPERASKGSPCYLFYFNISYFIFCYLMHIQMSVISYGGNLK